MRVPFHWNLTRALMGSYEGYAFRGGYFSGRNPFVPILPKGFLSAAWPLRVWYHLHPSGIKNCLFKLDHF